MHHRRKDCYPGIPVYDPPIPPCSPCPGLPGAQGAQGAPGLPFASEYAFSYSSSSQDVDVGQSVPFEFNGPISSGILHPPLTTDFTINVAGIYRVDMRVDSSTGTNWGLFQNGGLVASGNFFSSESRFVFIDVNIGDVLNIQRTAIAPPTVIVIRAQIGIEKLS